MTGKKRSLGNSKRFEVFKRDGFICQYCGNHPPKTVLEVDHIKPVSKGGNNGLYNLITSCFECNRGKAARDLKVIPKSLADKALEAKEKEKQILGYQKIIEEEEKRLEDEAWKILDYLGLVYDDGRALKSHIVTTKNFIKKSGYFDVLNSAEIAISKEYVSDNFTYFCGVCWNKIKENNNG